MVIGKCTIKPGGELINHKHKIPEYYYVLDGEGEINLNGIKKPLIKDTFIEIPKNTYHYTKNMLQSDLTFLYIFPNGPFETIKYYQ